MPEQKPTKEIEITNQQLKEERKRIAKGFIFQDHPDAIIKEFIEASKKYLKDNEKNKEQFDKSIAKTSMTIGLDTHIPAIYAVHADYRPLVVEFINLLYEEFEVNRPSEKALVQLIATSYVRSMVLSRQLTSTLTLGTTSQNLNGFYGVISKDLDRAQRQFTAALTLLKELKSPAIQVNVKTNTAFIAQNQQLNNQPYENNNP